MHTHTRFAALLLLTSSLPAYALQAGDLMFTSFNADRDGWSVVALAELAPHTTVYFSDNRWDSAASLFVGSESYHRWDSGPQPLTAGAVVHFDRIDHAQLLTASAGVLARARVAGSSTYGLSQSGETVYAYLGSSATTPTQFLSAISTEAFAAGSGGLSGTGLTPGVNATALAAGSDYADYAGPRAGLAAPQFAALTAQPSNWQDWGDVTDAALSIQAPRVTAFAVTAVPEPGPLGLAAVGAAVLLMWRRRWHRKQRSLAALLALLATTATTATTAQAAEQVTQVLELGALAAPITMFIGDAFNDLDPSTPGLQLKRAGTALTLNPGDTFIDQYRFQVAAVEFSAIASTIDLAVVFNVNALQVHLYGDDSLQLSTLGATQGITGMAPTASASGSDELQTLQPLPLAAGTYVMEVRGQVAGLAGGSYAGVINLSPVPESSAWLMALAGLGVVGWTSRRGAKAVVGRSNQNGPFGLSTGADGRRRASRANQKLPQGRDF